MSKCINVSVFHPPTILLPISYIWIYSGFMIHLMGRESLISTGG